MALSKRFIPYAETLLRPLTRDSVRDRTGEGFVGALCLTCGRPIDSEELVEGEPDKTTFAKVLVKHHGAEEMAVLDMGSVEWDAYELRRVMTRHRFFDPTLQLDRTTVGA